MCMVTSSSMVDETEICCFAGVDRLKDTLLVTPREPRRSMLAMR